MNEGEHIPEKEKNIGLKSQKWAGTLSKTSLCIGTIFLIFYLWPTACSIVRIFSYLAFLMPLAIAIVLGFIAIYIVKRRKEYILWKYYAISGILISSLTLSLITFGHIIPISHINKNLPDRFSSISNAKLYLAPYNASDKELENFQKSDFDPEEFKKIIIQAKYRNPIYSAPYWSMGLYLIIIEHNNGQKEKLLVSWGGSFFKIVGEEGQYAFEDNKEAVSEWKNMLEKQVESIQKNIQKTGESGKQENDGKLTKSVKVSSVFIQTD